jgi:GT2 family glycosyltransferase
MDERFLTESYPVSPPVYLRQAAFLRPEYLSLRSQAWLEHVPFAFALIEMLQPRTFVELGVYAGDSYCAFCQAIQWFGLTTRCHGIDSWSGDIHVGEIETTVLDELRSYHDPKYGGFSQLLQSRFTQAACHFADHSLDLLHIDGCHTYEAVRADWQTWQSKLSERGVVLFHDTQVRWQDFGVWHLWQELAECYPSFEFSHGHGLGMLLVGNDVPTTLREWTTLAAEERELVRGMYAALGQGVLREYELRRLQQERKDTSQFLPPKSSFPTEPTKRPFPLPTFPICPTIKKRTNLFRSISPWRTLASICRIGPGPFLRIAKSGLFDRAYYQTQYQTKKFDGWSALEHFLSDGWKHGLNPHPLFDCNYYREQHADVACAGVNPFLHFLQHGAAEGRNPHPCFDSDFYARQHTSLAKLPPLLHYLRHCQGDPHPLFDSAYYRNQCADLPENVSPLVHYLTEGGFQGLHPHPLFDSAFYLSNNPDVARARVNPLVHFLRHGWQEGRDPSPLFSLTNYLEANPEVKHQKMNPLLHYVLAQRLTKAVSASVTIPVAQELEQACQILGPCEEAFTSGLAIGAVLYCNPATEVETFLHSLPRSEHRRAKGKHRLLLHGNSSWSETQLASLVKDSNCHFSHTAENLGFARAHNRLMKQAFETGAEYYLAVNPDGLFHPDCIRNLVAMANQLQGKALLEAMQFPGEHPKRYDPCTLDTAWASGACLLIPRILWDTIGGFDENFFLYCEDVDYSWRARRAGFAVKICPRALFCHDTTDRPPSLERERAMLISGRYLAWKWGDVAFQKRMERELLARNLAHDTELPKWDERCRISDPGTIPDFAHLFHFGPARW